MKVKIRQFARRYATYRAWRRGRKVTPYVRGIILKHKQNPQATLVKLRGAKQKIRIRKTVSVATQWKAFSSREKREYNLALEVLRRLRKGSSFEDAVKGVGLSEGKALHYLGKYVRKHKGKYLAKSFDRLTRPMVIYEKGRITSLMIDDSRTASLIGEYFSAVRRFLFDRKTKHLREFKDVIIRDVQGNHHTLETDPEAILEIQDQIERPEEFMIYRQK